MRMGHTCDLAIEEDWSSELLQAPQLIFADLMGSMLALFRKLCPDFINAQHQGPDLRCLECLEDRNVLKLRSLDSSCPFFLSDNSIWGQ